ncbi:MAG: HAD-IA family hydrolase [Clostridia bacterium]|nr:HAD-IA family hydrolase [Clostridia bacterium]
MNDCKAAVFDLDGTILDTLDDLADSLAAVLHSAGLPERTWEETRRFVGNGIRLLIERAVPPGTDEKKTDEVYAAFLSYYGAHCAEKTAPYPGIAETLAALRRAGIRTAVVSNKADAPVKTLVARYFPSLFDAAVGEREGIRRKPAPDSLFEVIRLLGVSPGETVYIGDSDVDIETAKNAGIPCLSVTWGFRSRDFLCRHGAGKLVDRPEELIALLAGKERFYG